MKPIYETGLKFYVLDCGCIYYQRVFPDGALDVKIGVCRNAEDGPCEICLLRDAAWKERSLDESIVHIVLYVFRAVVTLSYAWENEVIRSGEGVDQQTMRKINGSDE